jgi:hypothetical protein
MRIIRGFELRRGLKRKEGRMDETATSSSVDQKE